MHCTCSNHLIFYKLSQTTVAQDVHERGIFDFRPPSESIAFTLDWVTILTWDFFPAKLKFLIDHSKLVSSNSIKRSACGNDLKMCLAKKVQILICNFHGFWGFPKNTQFSKCHRSQSTQPIFKFKDAMDCQYPNG